MYSRVIRLYIYLLFQILFPFRLFQDIEQSSLCYTIGTYWLYILNIEVIEVCRGQSNTPNSSPPPSLLLNLSLFSLWVCFCFVNKFIYIIFFLDSAYKWYHMILVFVYWLILLSMITSWFIHVAANGIILFFFKKMSE